MLVTEDICVYLQSPTKILDHLCTVSLNKTALELPNTMLTWKHVCRTVYWSQNVYLSLGRWMPCCSLVCGVCTVCPGLLVFPLDTICRLCSVILATSRYLLHYFGCGCPTATRFNIPHSHSPFSWYYQPNNYLKKFPANADNAKFCNQTY